MHHAGLACDRRDTIRLLRRVEGFCSSHTVLECAIRMRMRFKEYLSQLPPYKPPRLIASQPQGMAKLSSNENPLGPSPKAVEALREAVLGVHRYPDAGALALRQGIAARWGLAPEQVICSNGSDELVLLLCLGFLREGDEVVMAHGTFISYYLRSLSMGGLVRRVPLRDYAHDLAAMAEAITGRTRLFFLCNPNNPTGTTNRAEEVTWLLDRLPDHVLLVVDEAYIEFVERSDYPDLLTVLRAGRQNVLLLRTFAKIYGLAGLRLGYALAPAQIVEYLDRARPVFNVNALAQAAGLAALDDDDHVARSRDYARTWRERFMAELGGLGLNPVPSETNFVAFHVDDDLAVTMALMERGFTVTPLSGWGLPGLVRVSFGLPDENERFFEALRAVVQG